MKDKTSQRKTPRAVYVLLVAVIAGGGGALALYTIPELWPELEARLHPSFHNSLDAVEKHVASLERSLHRLSDRVESLSKTPVPEKTADDAETPRSLLLLEARHYLLQAERQAQGRQPQQALNSLRMAHTALNPLYEREKIKSVRHLLDKEISALERYKNDAGKEALETLAGLLSAEPLSASLQQSTSPQETFDKPSFWEKPADFVMSRLERAVSVQQDLHSSQVLARSLLRQTLLIARNAVLMHDEDGYRQAVHNALQLMRSDADLGPEPLLALSSIRNLPVGGTLPSIGSAHAALQQVISEGL